MQGNTSLELRRRLRGGVLSDGCIDDGSMPSCSFLTTDSICMTHTTCMIIMRTVHSSHSCHSPLWPDVTDYSPALADESPALPGYNPDVTRYRPDVTDYSPAVTGYTPALTG